MNGHRTTNALFGRRRHGFVIRVGMQAVAIVVNREKRLQGGSDVVEVDFLSVQRSPARLNVIFQFLRTLVGTVFFFHRDGPNAASDAAAKNGVLGI